MCGRCTLTVEFSAIIEAFNLEISTSFPYKPSYNIAPSQAMPIIINEGEKHHAVGMQWGLTSRNLKKQIINARSETVAQKPTFKKSFEQRRCLIPADGFFEWKQTGKQKQPYYFYLNAHRLFAFAGIYQTILSDTNELCHTFCLLTTAANTFMQPYHHRMPVIFNQTHQYQQWLNHTTELNIPLSMLKPLQNALHCHPVANAVNNVRHNTSDCIEPLVAQTRQLSFFEK